jgi:hypothetical protein
LSASLAIHRPNGGDQDPDEPDELEDPEEPEDPEDPEEPPDPDDSEPLLVVDDEPLPESFDPLPASLEPPSPPEPVEPLPPPVLLDEPLRLSVR